MIKLKISNCSVILILTLEVEKPGDKKESGNVVKVKLFINNDAMDVDSNCNEFILFSDKK
jgi:hypothetical protein